MSNLYYLLNDVPLRITKVSGKNHDAVVELRDPRNRPFVLPSSFVDQLPVIREPDQNTVWTYETTGNPMVYHNGFFHHPSGNVSLGAFVTNPDKFIPMQPAPRIVDEFHEQLQGLMDDNPSSEFTLSWNDGRVEVMMWMGADETIYGHGSSVGVAVEEIATKLFDAEHGGPKL